MTAPSRDRERGPSREVLSLAVPAFLALVAEPLFLLADAAIVGRLGTLQLAGLGIAGAILQTIVGLCIFLAYGTTASVARHLGAGERRRALAQGLDGIWLAVVIGVLVTVGTLPAARPVVDLFGSDTAVSDYAATYLRWALLGVTPALVMLAATGVLRGLLDTRTPLVVAIAGNLLNVGLNLLLVYGLDLGIAGSAIGTDLAQLASAVAMVTCVVRVARREGAPLSPVLVGMRRAGAAGVPLLVRTVAQRTSLLGMTYAAAQLDSTTVATQQLALTIWLFLSFVLDAIAIAAQALTGRFLGAGDVERTRNATALMIRWGLVVGAVTGAGLAVVSPWVGWLFTTDEAVVDLLVPTLLVAALFQPVAGVAFVLDGVLIGAGDGQYLARAAVIVLVVFAPLAALAIAFPPPGVPPLAWLWVAFGVGFIGGRAAILLRRARGTAWMVTGVH